jgi:quinol monooxygenase YgiN
MYSRVWHLDILPGKLEEFAEAVRTLVPEARKERGFRGFLVLRAHSDKAKPRALMIGLWESRSHLRASDRTLFLPRAMAHLIAYCEGYPLIQEHEVMVSELVRDTVGETCG